MNGPEGWVMQVAHEVAASSNVRAETAPTRSPLTAREERIAAAVAAATMPPGRFLEGGGAGTVAKLRRWLADASPSQVAGIRALLWSAEALAIPSTGRPFSRLARERAERLLVGWQTSRFPLRRFYVRALVTALKAAHFDDPVMAAHVGCAAPPAAVKDEAPRWMRQVTNGREVDADLDLECEVVVVGTGAGGAACAFELASRGRAVLLLEEGDYHRRSSFKSRPSETFRKLYRDQAMTVALGNVGVPVWTGRAVGGSTVINSGTCYRAPEPVFRAWRDELGLAGFSSDAMAPYYERVEQMLQVAPASFELTGGVGRVIARGAEKLRLSHHPLVRNAPGCDGQGVCCFGCPTGAKRSTDVSYVPEALARGAQLVTAAHVDAIDVALGRARGVSGTLGEGGRRFRVRADAVVIAGGALMTPVLLAKSGAVRHPMLGKNLSIHPATKVMAIFDEDIDMSRGIPQGYAIDSLAAEGIMFEGASTPLDVTAIAVPWVGARFMELMEAYRQVATFGFMIRDSSRGTVRPGPNGTALLTYNLNAADTQKMQRGIALLCDVFLAAGARRVLPFLAGSDEVRAPRDVAALRARSIAASEIEVTAFHPLGTCRIGSDPRNSVLSPDHEVNGVAALYVADGSAVPTPLGVNPQMTIMAMALRAAELIDDRLASRA
jgi:choline dehydrogenase-like flavoprotein